MSNHRCLGWIVLLVALAGCSSENEVGIAVRGKVTVGGQPLSGAVITLEPLRGTLGPNASASIFDGQFSFRPDAGMVGGRYRVRIAMLPTEILQALPADQREKLPKKNAVVDPNFDRNSNLVCELTRGQENVLEFDINFL